MSSLNSQELILSRVDRIHGEKGLDLDPGFSGWNDLPGRGGDKTRPMKPASADPGSVQFEKRGGSSFLPPSI